jgi:hypothetical protein
MSERYNCGHPEHHTKDGGHTVSCLLLERDDLQKRLASARAALEEIRRGKMPEDQGRYDIMAARLVGIASRALSEISTPEKAAGGEFKGATLQHTIIADDRCMHGVWLGDHCWTCEKEALRGAGK